MIKRLDANALGLLRSRAQTGYDIWKWLDEMADAADCSSLPAPDAMFPTFGPDPTSPA